LARLQCRALLKQLRRHAAEHNQVLVTEWEDRAALQSEYNDFRRQQAATLVCAEY